jgi:hypothetical protein
MITNLSRHCFWQTLCVVVALLPLPAIAQVTNPGFELGGAGWTQYGGGNFVTGNYFGMTPPQGNGYWAAVRNFGGSPDEGLFQTITTTPGVSYTLTVAGQAHNRANTTGGNEFVYINGQASDFPGDTDVRIGVDLTGGVNPNAAGVVYSPAVNTGAQWQDIMLNFIASGPSTTIFLDSRQQFAFEGNWTGFDNVRLVAQPTQAVPEPTTIALWGIASAAVLLFLRRRVASA